ncbi:hypothetical protein ACFE04_013233 [Oxalis oulophora]
MAKVKGRESKKASKGLNLTYLIRESIVDYKVGAFKEGLKQCYVNIANCCTDFQPQPDYLRRAILYLNQKSRPCPCSRPLEVHKCERMLVDKSARDVIRLLFYGWARSWLCHSRLLWFQW